MHNRKDIIIFRDVLNKMLRGGAVAIHNEFIMLYNPHYREIVGDNINPKVILLSDNFRGLLKGLSPYIQAVTSEEANRIGEGNYYNFQGRRYVLRT